MQNLILPKKKAAAGGRRLGRNTELQLLRYKGHQGLSSPKTSNCRFFSPQVRRAGVKPANRPQINGDSQGRRAG